MDREMIKGILHLQDNVFTQSFDNVSEWRRSSVNYGMDLRSAIGSTKKYGNLETVTELIDWGFLSTYQSMVRFLPLVIFNDDVEAFRVLHKRSIKYAHGVISEFCTVYSKCTSYGVSDNIVRDCVCNIKEQYINPILYDLAIWERSFKTIKTAEDGGVQAYGLGEYISSTRISDHEKLTAVLWYLDESSTPYDVVCRQLGDFRNRAGVGLKKDLNIKSYPKDRKELSGLISILLVDRK